MHPAGCNFPREELPALPDTLFKEYPCLSKAFYFPILDKSGK